MKLKSSKSWEDVVEHSFGYDVFFESINSYLEFFLFLVLGIFEFDLHFLLSSWTCIFPAVLNLACALISSKLARSICVVSKHISQQ